MSQVFLSIGSNIGDRHFYLEEAINLLIKNPEIALEKRSSIYETEPYGYKEQAKFLNMVIELTTTLSPSQLLELIQKIEKELGRERVIHWGPRTVDLDILLYDNLELDTEVLKIPHPFMKKRLFVLLPLSEIYAGSIPKEKVSILELIESLHDQKEGIERWKM